MPTGLPCMGAAETWTSFTIAQGLWEVVRGQHPIPAQGSPYPPWVGVTADILPPCVRGSWPEEPTRKGFLPRPLVTLRLGGFLLLWTHFFHPAKWTYSRRCLQNSALTIIKPANCMAFIKYLMCARPLLSTGITDDIDKPLLSRVYTWYRPAFPSHFQYQV